MTVHLMSLAAAADLIARRGYLGVSLGDIEMFDRVIDQLIADAEQLLRTADRSSSSQPAAVGAGAAG